jgi:Uma2 family endonuclease
MAMHTDTDLEDYLYPDSDGKPMADNTLQFLWIVTLQGNLAFLFREQPDVFVAGDLLWYAVQGSPSASVAPDTMVVFGRPKGHRGSYRQWREAGIAPQVVFEVLSPNNTDEEMDQKLDFYNRHGVEEYYLYDPDGVELFGWQRLDGALQAIPEMHGWVSPRLRIRFDLSGPELAIYKPNGERFLSYEELAADREAAVLLADAERQQREQAERSAEQERRRRERAERRAEKERQQREQAEQLAEKERQDREEAERRAKQERKEREQAERRAKQERKEREQAEQDATAERERAERLAAKLRELGIDPDT